MNRLVLPVLIVVYSIAALLYHTKTESSNIFHGDAGGYYAYLPAVFFHADKSFEAVQADEAANGIYTDYIVKINTSEINKYPVGVAVLTAPFYLTANLFETDQYGPTHRFFMVLAALVYVFLGFLVLKKLLIYLDLSLWPLFFTAIGSNLLYISISAPLMSHVYSFSLIAAFAYFGIRSVRERKHGLYILSATIFALILLVRPVNGLILLFVPFLIALGDMPLSALKPTLRVVFVALIIGIAILSVQIVAWYMQTGQLFIWSYPGEGFNWFESKPGTLWFGFRKGLFTYTPILLLLFVSVVAMYRKNRLASYAFLPGFVVLSFVFAAWWDPGYGDSFGLRPFMDYYGIFILAMAFAFSGHLIKWTIGFSIAASALTLFQSYQYHKRILHPNNMSFAKYKHAFLKWDETFRGCFGSEMAPLPFGVKRHLIKSETFRDLQSGEEFLATLEVQHDRDLRVEFEAEKFSSHPINYRETFLVAHGFDVENNTTEYRLTPFYEINTESYGSPAIVRGAINLPAAHHYRFYIWNPNKLGFEIRYFTITIFALVNS